MLDAQLDESLPPGFELVLIGALERHVVEARPELTERDVVEGRVVLVEAELGHAAHANVEARVTMTGSLSNSRLYHATLRSRSVTVMAMCVTRGNCSIADV